MAKARRKKLEIIPDIHTQFENILNMVRREEYLADVEDRITGTLAYEDKILRRKNERGSI